MSLNNSNRTRKEFVPRIWKDRSPFKKSSKIPLPIYSTEELILLAKYFDNLRTKSVSGTGSITASVAGSTVKGIYPSSHVREGINQNQFRDLLSFHQFLKSEPHRIPPFRIPFLELPLYLGKPSGRYYLKYWDESVVSWRLQIGK